MDTVEVNGFTFDVEIRGPVEGEVVVALHGFPQDHSSWSQIVPALHDAGYRTVAPDQRGYSPGARPSAIADYRLGPLTSDVIGLLDALGIERAHVVGHDWGGAVAWAVAASAPHRVISLTVLSTPHPGAMKRAMLRSTQGLKSWYMGVFAVPLLAEQLMAPGRPMWRGIMRGLPVDSVAHYTANAQSPGALTAMLNWYRGLLLDLVRPSLRMHRITVPVLYVWGERDPSLGEAAARASADYVTGPYEFVVLERSGHWLPERAVDEVTEALLAHLNRYGDHLPS